MSPVKPDTKHPDYQKFYGKWNMIDDICDAENLDRHLVKLNPSDDSKENEERNRQYAELAVFYQVAGYTCNGLLGIMFKKVPKLEISESMGYVTEDVSGEGVSIYQHAQQTAKNVIRKGRCGLLVDFPKVEGPAISRLDMEENGIRSSIKLIEPENIINWKLGKVGGKSVLVDLSIYDCIRNDAGDELDQVTRYFLDGSKSVVRELYQKKTIEADEKWIMVESSVIFSGKGTPMTEIPFVFVGSEFNSSAINQPPMYNICAINKGMYNNSAAYEDSVNIVGQVQPWMSGVTQEHIDMMNRNNMYIGSRELLGVPPGESFAFAQASPNMIAMEAMKHKVEMMIGMGAMFIQPGSAVKTATQSEGEMQVSYSVLSLIAYNVSEGYEKALYFACQFMNIEPGEIEFTINTEFVPKNADAATIQALVAAWVQNAIPFRSMMKQFQKMNIVDPEEKVEDIEAEVNSSRSNSMPNLDDETGTGE